MREIKFRGFDEIAQGWCIGCPVKDKDIKGRYWIMFNENEGAIIDNPKTIEQYTGFKDSKGNEIYEGDILSDSVQTDEGIVHSKNQVFWNEFTGSFHLDNSFKQDQSCSTELWMELNDFKYKVVGNIHDK